jgi:hypothetical protein
MTIRIRHSSVCNELGVLKLLREAGFDIVQKSDAWGNVIYEAREKQCANS